MESSTRPSATSGKANARAACAAAKPPPRSPPPEHPAFLRLISADHDPARVAGFFARPAIRAGHTANALLPLSRRDTEMNAKGAAPKPAMRRKKPADNWALSAARLPPSTPSLVFPP